MFRPNWPSSGVQVVMVNRRGKKPHYSEQQNLNKEYEEGIVNDVAHRRRKNSQVRSIQCNEMLKYNILQLYHCE
jgi:hypothetical protein